jgi:hypothetical protein
MLRSYSNLIPGGREGSLNVSDGYWWQRKARRTGSCVGAWNFKGFHLFHLAEEGSENGQLGSSIGPGSPVAEKE